MLSKRKILIILSPLLFVVLVMLSFRVVDFLPGLNGWHRINYGDRYNLLAIRDMDSSLWFAELWGNELHSYHPNRQETDALVTQALIDDLCVTDKVWLVSVKSPIITSVSLNGDPVDEVIYPEIEQLGEVSSCETTNENDLIFVGPALLAIVDRQDLSPNYWDVKAELVRVSQDDTGNFWALTRNGEIYIADSSDYKWHLFGTINDQAYQLEYIDHALWIGSNSGVYHWSLGSEKIEPDQVLSAQETGEGFIVSIDEVLSGVVWITTTDGIWAYQAGQLTQIELPLLIKHIAGVAFDEQTGKIYLATDRGIFFREIEVE